MEIIKITKKCLMMDKDEARKLAIVMSYYTGIEEGKPILTDFSIKDFSKYVGSKLKEIIEEGE